MPPTPLTIPADTIKCKIYFADDGNTYVDTISQELSVVDPNAPTFGDSSSCPHMTFNNMVNQISSILNLTIG